EPGRVRRIDRVVRGALHGIAVLVETRSSRLRAAISKEYRLAALSHSRRSLPAVVVAADHRSGVGQRVVGPVLGMGLERSGSAGGVDGLRGVLAYPDRSWLARKTKRLLCAAGIRAGDLHVAGGELHHSGASLVRGCVGAQSKANALLNIILSM